MASFLDEAQVEMSLVGMFQGLGYDYAFGPDIACDGPRPERSNYADVVLDGRLRSALARINRTIPADAIEEAIRKVTRAESPSPSCPVGRIFREF